MRSKNICEPIVKKMWEPRHVTTLQASMACHRDFYFLYIYIIYNLVTLRVSRFFACIGTNFLLHFCEHPFGPL
jgi:hypothetical protein